MAMCCDVRGSQEPQAQSHPHEMPTDSWYPPSVISSSNSSRPATPGSGTSGSFGMSRPTDRSNSLSNVSPAEAAGIIAMLKDKSFSLSCLLPNNVSVDELRKLLSDKVAYQNLLHSLEPVKTQNRVRDELRNKTLQLASEERIWKKNHALWSYGIKIIRTTELATAQEKLHDLERYKEETLKYYSPSSLLHRLQEAMNETERNLKHCIGSFLIEKSIFQPLYRNTRNCAIHIINALLLILLPRLVLPAEQ